MPWRLIRDGKFMIYGITPPEEILTWATKDEAERVALYVANDYGEFGWEPIEWISGVVNRKF